MSSDLVVGVAVVLMVIGSVAYLIHQRRMGRSSCGCSGCNACRGRPKTVDIDDGEGCDCCRKN